MQQDAVTLGGDPGELITPIDLGDPMHLVIVQLDVGGWTISGGLRQWNEITAEQAAMVLRDIAEGAVVL